MLVVATVPSTASRRDGDGVAFTASGVGLVAGPLSLLLS